MVLKKEKKVKMKNLISQFVEAGIIVQKQAIDFDAIFAGDGHMVEPNKMTFDQYITSYYDDDLTALPQMELESMREKWNDNR